MASFLEGSLKRQIYKGFKGRLLKGQIRRETVVLDVKGDQRVIGYSDHKFEGIRENFSLYWRAQAGIPETDVGILVLLGSTDILPQPGDKVLLGGAWHHVRRTLEIDPAGASIRLQVYQIPDPTPITLDPYHGG